MGTLLTVVGGCSRSGAAAFSFSQRSAAAVSVTVAMIGLLSVSLLLSGEKSQRRHEQTCDSDHDRAAPEGDRQKIRAVGPVRRDQINPFVERHTEADAEHDR